MREITWRMTSPLGPSSRIAAAVQAFCALRRPDTTATIFEVDGEEVDLTQELKNNPALRDAGERVHYLLPKDGEGRAIGPFMEDEIPPTGGAQVLTMDLLTGVVSISQTH